MNRTLSPSRRPALALHAAIILITVTTPVGFASDEVISVQAALEAEVAGDTTRRNTLLARVLQEHPDHNQGRWQAGFVWDNDNWATIAQAADSKSKKGLVDEYRGMRNRYAGQLAGELLLAKWCRKKGLKDRERLHWVRSLNMDPGNEEARRHLGVREFRGQLMTAEQIVQLKEGMKEYRHALETWDSKLSLWLRAIGNSPTPRRTEAWRRLMSIYDREAVPSLEKIFPKVDHALQLDIVSVLGNFEDQIATDVLVRVALYSEDSEIREAAAEELGTRSWFAFVPNLLGRLEAAIEFTYVTRTLGAAVFSEVHFFQENPATHVYLSHAYSAQVPVSIRRNSLAAAVTNASIRQQRLLSQEAAKQYRSIFESLRTAQAKNAQSSMFNERVYAALERSTGEQHGYQPQQWWDWWRDYNELDDSEEKPRISYRRRHHYHKKIVVGGLSCFAGGTPVWTDTGPLAIEHIRPGDRVLSQDPNSGELAYKVVIDTTIRPPSPTVQFEIADETIIATMGHPIWKVGAGWKMAKHLNAGDRLHGVQGGVTVEAVEPGPVVQAFNLVVAENNTYFVGEKQLLVHDNMPRTVTELPLPGWLANKD